MDNFKDNNILHPFHLKQELVLQHKYVSFLTRQPGFYRADCGLSSATFKLQNATGRLGKK